MGIQRSARSTLVRRAALGISAALLISGTSFLGVSAAADGSGSSCPTLFFSPRPVCASPTHESSAPPRLRSHSSPTVSQAGGFGSKERGSVLRRSPRAPRRQGAARHGVLRGELMVCCTAKGSTPFPGIVRITRVKGRSRLVRVGHSGRFSVPLPVGSYHVVGGSPQFHWPIGSCHLTPPNSSAPRTKLAHIHADATTRVLIVCQGQ